MASTRLPGNPEDAKVPPIKLKAGHGRIVVSTHAAKAQFEELVAAYPLKLLSPRVGADGVAVAYILSYGGGLVGGDEVVLSVIVRARARLVLLSQGSTKVFKVRHGGRLAVSGRPETHVSPAPSADALHLRRSPLTTQTMEYTVGEGCGLYLLPDSVTCFRDASYKQVQKFHLRARTSSLVILDSITSGRQAMGEDWDFARYYSLNEVWVEGKLLAKDVLLLDGDPLVEKGGGDSENSANSRRRLPRRNLREQLAPYSCYAMVLLYGPQVRETVQDIAEQYRQHIVYQRRKPTDSVWSFTLLGESDVDGAVVRVAGIETELVRMELKNILRRLDRAIGDDTYKRAFA